jgi:hypothetical protein
MLVASMVAAFGVGSAPAAAMPTNPDVDVRTLAGSGAAGFADGDSMHASFVMPFGLTYGPDGTLYVSDAGAQRIRAIGASGSVRTLAGGEIWSRKVFGSPARTATAPPPKRGSIGQPELYGMTARCT